MWNAVRADMLRPRALLLKKVSASAPPFSQIRLHCEESSELNRRVAK